MPEPLFAAFFSSYAFLQDSCYEVAANFSPAQVRSFFATWDGQPLRTSCGAKVKKEGAGLLPEGEIKFGLLDEQTRQDGDRRFSLELEGSPQQSSPHCRYERAPHRSSNLPLRLTFGIDRLFGTRQRRAGKYNSCRLRLKLVPRP
jgi:hypothetical protein